MEEIERIRTRFLVLQKRLKTERLFVKSEKEQLQVLNEKVGSLSQNLFYLEWKTRQQWLNVDRLVWGGRANPSECSVTSRIIDSAKFEDASNYLNYEDYKYGNFLLCLKENPHLIALILNYCDSKRIQNSTMQLVKLFLSSLYGNCIQQVDEVFVLKILKELMILQVFTCEDLLDFFCGKRSTDNAFACVMTIFSGSLFSSKLYLTAALHGSVMQVIVDDSVFLDVEVSKALCRIAPKVAVEKFGRPGTVEAHNKTKQHMNMLHKHLIYLCKKFLKNLVDKVYCFPQSLCWAIGQLYQGMIQKMKLPQANAKALIGHIIMSYFICPAIINPEPYGINSDADISETARHNLGQVASILRSLALLECGLKDEKLTNILENFDMGVITDYISALIDGSEKIDIEQLDDSASTIIKCSLLISEHDLKTMIKCLLLLQTYNIPGLNEEGFTELLDNLPTFPQHWVKEFPNHSKSAVSSSLYLEENVQNLTKFDNTQQLEVLRDDLNKIISEEIPILIIPIKMESEDIPGMLSEEKVLGKKDAYIPSFDIETTDQKQRTSTLMLGALRESLNDTGSNEDLSSGSETSSKENKVYSDEVEAFFGTGKKADKSCNQLLVVDNLINIDEEETPKLPEKQHSKRLSNDAKNLENYLINHPQTPNSEPQTLNNTFIDVNEQPLLYFDHSVLREDSMSKKGNRNSSISLFDGPGGINAILQGATIKSSPNSPEASSNEVENFWLPTVNKKSDPWGTSNQNTINEENNLFENSFTSLTKNNSLPNKASYSVDKGYANYSETIQREVKNLKQNKDDAELCQSPTDNKFFRKKSHGGWLKDKISSKINTGFTKHSKKYDTDIKKDTDSQVIKLGTPLEASEESRKKTHSFSRNSKLVSADAGEAILAKYRSIALLPTSHSNDGDSNFSSSPMSSHMEGAIDVCREELAVFDNEFKFSDAKKKLRMVLCTTDQITLPSKATSFDQLLLTMLQAKLAEAINLQDRFSVAQLHETLRSIKQLPQGSCDQLITQLEAEYEERSKYISYLIKSKQGLLSTISYLEQLTTKLQRDKTICSKYFTTLAVRLFLETPARKHQIVVFSQKFASNKMLDEKSALLNELLEELNSDILKEPTWKYCTDEQLSDAEKAIERAIISRIYKDAFYPFSSADIENDKIFHENIKGLASIVTLSHPTLQIPKMYQKEAPWPSAQTELLMINAYKTAADKLSCIHRCCITIMNLLSMASDKHTPGADDFVPVLVYVVLRANPPNLLSTKQYVNTFYETRLNGEEYYCWMQFCAAVEFIKTLLSSLLKPPTN